MPDAKEIVWINNVLKKLDFVSWDRYVEVANRFITVFGWIDREQDSYKDFLVLQFTLKDDEMPSCVLYLATSSEKHSNEIADILGSQHQDCARVEYLFDIPNVIKEGTK